jgi:hypothetical protein
MSVSAIGPLHVAIDTVILRDPKIRQLLKGERVYSGQAPKDTAELPYILLGQSTETRLRMFGPNGNTGTQQIGVWSAKMDKHEAIEICGHLTRLLDGTRLALPADSGLHFCSGSFEIISIGDDGSGKYIRGACMYEVLTFA